MSGPFQNTSLRSIIIFLNVFVAVGIFVWFAPEQNLLHFLTVLPNNSTQVASSLRNIHKDISFTTGPREENDTPENSTKTPGHGLPVSDSKRSDGENLDKTQSTCNFIQVNAFDPSVMKKVRKYKSINCTQGFPSLVYLDEPYLKVNLSKVKSHPNTTGFMYCRYRPIFRSPQTDFRVGLKAWGHRFTTSILLSEEDEHIQVECYDKNAIAISSSYYSRIIQKDEEQKATLERYANHTKQFSLEKTMNVLMIGIDGLSVQNFERSMPKTDGFLRNVLNSTILQQFNKIAYNTFPNLIAMLTGQPSEYYVNGEIWTPKKYLDDISDYFIWSEYQKAGYNTALDLEEYYITAFHYLKKGWRTQPVTFYSRPSVIAMAGNTKLNSAGKFCKGDKPSILVRNNYMLELASRLNNSVVPYFGLSFLTLLTHDYQNKASAGDDLYLSFFQELHQKKLLNNTVLVLFSDHGARFGSLRYTYNGMIESKTPAMHIILPSWFQKKYPEEWKTLQINTRRLASAFDIHATLRHILHFKGSSIPPSNSSNIGISLFQKPIPLTRTCQDAGIPIEYCNCNSLTKVTLKKSMEESLASIVTKAIMALLKDYKDKCEDLRPKSVLSVLESPVPPDRIKSMFRPNSTLYQITVTTTPGHGTFEAMVEFSKKDNKARAIGSISRLDMYKGEKDCIHDSRVRVFCICK